MRFYKSLRRRLHVAASRHNPSMLPVVVVILLIVGILWLITDASKFMKDIATSMALSDARDAVTTVVNEKINEKMSVGKYDYDYFVTLQKDESGDITAISANMTRINSLASEILREVISSTTNGEIDIGIPIGNLMGSNILLGRGPNIPVKVIMLTSSYADFRNEINSAGINQIRHQIILELTVEVDVLMPWHVESANVKSEVLIAETIIVGSVPDTYLNLDTP